MAPKKTLQRQKCKYFHQQNDNKYVTDLRYDDKQRQDIVSKYVMLKFLWKVTFWFHAPYTNSLADLTALITVQSANCGHLHSTAGDDLVVPCSRTTRHGHRGFAVSGPSLWNSLVTTIISSWPITYTDSVLCAPGDHAILQSWWNTSTAFPWQFTL